MGSCASAHSRPRTSQWCQHRRPSSSRLPVPRPAHRAHEGVRRPCGGPRSCRPGPGAPLSLVVSANLDLVRSIYAAWERGDWSSAPWAHVEIEFVAADGPDPGKSIGVAAMTERWRQWVSAWEDYRSEADED